MAIWILGHRRYKTPEQIDRSGKQRCDKGGNLGVTFGAIEFPGLAFLLVL